MIISTSKTYSVGVEFCSMKIWVRAPHLPVASLVHFPVMGSHLWFSTSQASYLPKADNGQRRFPCEKYFSDVKVNNLNSLHQT